MVENLNKENFWNELKEKYPEAVEHFCNWIDEYKKEVGWNKLFNGGIDTSNGRGYETEAPKFHDLPFEMQNGILARYELELFNNREGAGSSSYETIAREYRAAIPDMFRDLQTSIVNRSRKLN